MRQRDRCLLWERERWDPVTLYPQFVRDAASRHEAGQHGDGPVDGSDRLDEVPGNLGGVVLQRWDVDHDQCVHVGIGRDRCDRLRVVGTPGGRHEVDRIPQGRLGRQLFTESLERRTRDSSGNSSPPASHTSAHWMPRPQRSSRSRPAALREPVGSPTTSRRRTSPPACPFGSHRAAGTRPRRSYPRPPAAPRCARPWLWHPDTPRPLFTTTIGLRRAMSRQSAAKRRGFPNDSRYKRMTSVRSSSPQ